MIWVVGRPRLAGKHTMKSKHWSLLTSIAAGNLLLYTVTAGRAAARWYIRLHALGTWLKQGTTGNSHTPIDILVIEAKQFHNGTSKGNTLPLAMLL